MTQSTAQYEWTAEDGSLTMRILGGVINSLAAEVRARAGAQSRQSCGILVGTTANESVRDGTPTVTVESIDALPIEASFSVSAAIQLLLDKWQRSRSRRVYAVGAYRIARPGDSEQPAPELLLSARIPWFTAIELVVEGMSEEGIAASICFQTKAGGPVQRERLVFQPEHGRSQAPAKLPLRAEAVPGLYGAFDAGGDMGSLPRPGFWTPRLGIGLACLAVLCITAAMIVKPNQSTPGSARRDVQTEGAYTDLGLTVERSGGNLIATWDRQTQGIAHATSGVLTIQDLSGRHNLLLNSEQLRAGRAIYPATNDDMTIRLQVQDNEKRIGTDTVRILNPVQVHGSPSSTVGDIGSRLDPAARDATPRMDKIQPREPVSRQATWDSVKPSPTPRATAESTIASTPIPDVPPAAVGVPALPAVEGAGVAHPDPPQPAQPAASSVRPQQPGDGLPPAGAGEQPAKAGEASLTSAPIPISAASPVLPRNVKALIHKRIEVTVTASVDATGRVTGATVNAAGANASGVLVDFIRTAAINAARLWRFEPARVNQRTVPGTCDIKFEFTPN